MVVIDLDPVLLQIGPLSIRWYGLMIAVGVLAGTWLTARLAERAGLSADDIYSGALWVVVAGMIGARLAHVVDKWQFYSKDPLRIVLLQEGGLAVWGAVAGGVLAAVWVGHRYRIPFWRFVDAAAPGTTLGLALGRIGCIVNGDVAGAPTQVPWAFVYQHPRALLPKPEYFSVPTHPYPLYDMLWSLALLGLLFYIRGRWRQPGLLFLTFVGAYALGRFLLTFLRQEEQFLFGLQQAQVFSLLALLVAGYLFLYLTTGRGRRPVRQGHTGARPGP